MAFLYNVKDMIHEYKRGQRKLKFCFRICATLRSGLNGILCMQTQRSLDLTEPTFLMLEFLDLGQTTKTRNGGVNRILEDSWKIARSGVKRIAL